MSSSVLPTYHEYSALEMPAQKKVHIKMCKLRLHSSGVFSNVYRGNLVEPKPEREIAVKKTWPESGQDAHKNYEVMMLLELSKEKHLNIVQVLFTFKTTAADGRVCESMVFDFMPSTLHANIKQLGGSHPNIVDIKIYTWQLFNGLYYLYKKRICHRDIKPQNILIDSDQGILKIGDFGSAKVMKPDVESTAYQVTRFYRPPELLLEAIYYTPLVDVWSSGCVLGEMLRGHVLFPGRDSKHQLRLIIDALGSPDVIEQQAMRAVTRLEGSLIGPRGFSHILPHCPRESIEFLQRILVYVPKHRLHGSALLSDAYFNELYAPNKKRSNGRFVSDVPSFKDMVEFGPKHNRRSRIKTRGTHSTESVATTKISHSSESIVPMSNNNKKRASFSNEGPNQPPTIGKKRSLGENPGAPTQMMSTETIKK